MECKYVLPLKNTQNFRGRHFIHTRASLIIQSHGTCRQVGELSVVSYCSELASGELQDREFSKSCRKILNFPNPAGKILNFPHLAGKILNLKFWRRSRVPKKGSGDEAVFLAAPPSNHTRLY